MKLEITERDLKLLKYAVTALALVLILQFMFLPGLERRQDLKLKLQETEAEVTLMKRDIKEIPSWEQTVKKQEKQLADATAGYYQPMENRQVDELLTGLVVGHGLFPVILDIDEAVPGIPDAYLYGKVLGEEKPAEISEENSEEDPAKPAAPEGYVSSVEAFLVLRGEQLDLLAFLDDLEQNYPAVQVRTLKIEEKTYRDTLMNPVEQLDISCRLAVYMCGGQ